MPLSLATLSSNETPSQESFFLALDQSAADNADQERRWKNEILALKTENEELRIFYDASLDSETMRSKEKDEEIARLRKELEETKYKLATREINCIQKDTEIAGLQRKLDGESKDKDAQVGTREERNDQLRGENVDLKKIEERQDAQIPDLHHELERMQQTCTRQDELLMSNRTRLMAHSKREAELQRKIKSLEDVIKQETESKMEVQRKLEAQKAITTRTDLRAAEAEGSLAAAQDEVTKAVSHHQATIHAQMAELSSNKVNIDKYRRDLGACENLINDIQADRDSSIAGLKNIVKLRDVMISEIYYVLRSYVATYTQYKDRDLKPIEISLYTMLLRVRRLSKLCFPQRLHLLATKEELNFTSNKQISRAIERVNGTPDEDMQRWLQLGVQGGAEAVNGREELARNDWRVDGGKVWIGSVYVSVD
ncbi:hypothetical protein P280DRAFT_536178 [Massarina eburnea CBS 473.64]|uniref:Uncharacterized protein n=1 Tax=Massarina eburnea CBS 473.64 TaxID=1395130 RepID=A0A6A6RJR6_9PLEO|nr:hypothetical protein P280DRAFT_536178 [Massarina eburnea CBS 473.64]